MESYIFWPVMLPGKITKIVSLRETAHVSRFPVLASFSGVYPNTACLDADLTKMIVLAYFVWGNAQSLVEDEADSRGLPFS